MTLYDTKFVSVDIRGFKIFFSDIENNILNILTEMDKPISKVRWKLIKPFTKFAAYIYQRLFINKNPGQAYFYLVYTLDPNQDRQYRWTTGNNPGKSAYYKVQLSSNSKIKRNEILYLASNMALSLSEGMDYYGDLEGGLHSVVEVRIIQLLDHRHNTFSHVIQSSTRFRYPHNGMSRFRDILINSADESMATSFKFFFEWIEHQGFTVSHVGAYKNCFCKSLLIARENKPWHNLSYKERKIISRKASYMMKYKLFPDPIPISYKTEDLFTAFECRDVLEEKEQIHVINYMFQTVKKIGYNGFGQKVRIIFVYGGHAMPIVPGNTNKNLFETHRLIKPITIEPRMECSSLCPTAPVLGVYDIETTADLVQPYAIGLWIPEVMIRVEIFLGLDCIEQFIKTVKQLEIPNLILFAHNGGKFDTIIVANKVFADDDLQTDRIADLHGRILNMVYETKYRPYNSTSFPKVNLKDSYPFLLCSLDDAGKMYNTETLKGHVDHDVITTENFMEQYEQQNVEDYLKADCECLMQCLDKFNDSFATQVGFEPLYNCLTRASIARKFFLSQFYDVEQYPIYHLPDSIDAFIRDAYFGGRTQVFRRGLFESDTMKYVDFVSLYPTVMLKELPYGKAKWIDFEDKSHLPSDFFGFARVIVKGGRKKGINPLRYRTLSGLCDPYFEIETDCVFFSEELRYASDPYFEYDIQYIGGYYFEKACHMSSVIKALFALKQRAKMEFGKDSSQYIAAKVLLNSMYGIFGMKIRGKRLKIIKNDHELGKYFSTGNLHNKQGQLCYITDRMTTSLRSVAIAAATTSYAHIMLMKTIVAIEQSGYPYYYCDTDSIIYDGPEDILPYPIGSDLGCLSRECPDGFRLAVAARKLYAIDTFGVKCKGFPKGNYLTKEITDKYIKFSGRNKCGAKHKLQFEDIVNVVNGMQIKVKFPIFRSGRNNWLKKKRTVTKLVLEKIITGNIPSRKILPDGEVLPPIINNGAIVG